MQALSNPRTNQQLHPQKVLAILSTITEHDAAMTKEETGTNAFLVAMRVKLGTAMKGLQEDQSRMVSFSDEENHYISTTIMGCLKFLPLCRKGPNARDTYVTQQEATRLSRTSLDLTSRYPDQTHLQRLLRRLALPDDQPGTSNDLIKQRLYNLYAANPKKLLEIFHLGFTQDHDMAVASFRPFLQVYHSMKTDLNLPLRLDQSFFDLILYDMFSPNSIRHVLKHLWKLICEYFPNRRLPLTREKFNTSLFEGCKGLSPVFFLCLDHHTRQVLETYWDTLFPLFTQTGFTQPVESFEHQDRSAVYYLFDSTEGLMFLERHWADLYPLITREAMQRKTDLPRNGQPTTTRMSAEDCLFRNAEGIAFYERHANDFKKLGISNATKNPSAVAHHASPLASLDGSRVDCKVAPTP